MTKNKTTTKKKTENTAKKTMSNKVANKYIDTLLQDTLLLVGCAFTIFLSIALISYNILDPSLFMSTTDNRTVHNIAGLVGAYTADILYHFLGMSSWWIIFSLMTLLIRYYVPIHSSSDQSKLYYPWIGSLGLFLLLLSSPILEFVLLKSKLQKFLPAGAGGSWGDYITPHAISLFGIQGSILFSFVLILIGFSLLLQVSWLVLIGKIGYQLEIFFSLFKKILTKGISSIQFSKDAKKQNKIVDKVKRLNKDSIEQPDFAVSNRKKIEIKNLPPKQINLPFEEIEQVISPSKNSLPSIALLNTPEHKEYSIDKETLEKKAKTIEEKLAEFGIKIAVHSVTTGPVVTRFEIEPAQGIKGSQIVNLNKDLARSLSLHSVRIVETIYGKSTMGIEIPNEVRESVSLSEILSSDVFLQSDHNLTIALGKDISGVPVVADLSKMPHLLIAGTTGSGKSVAVNAFIISLLYKSMADDVRMIMIDPKMLELSVYEDIPHLLTPVVTDMKKAHQALNWCVSEMEKRYRLLSHFDVRNIDGFNQKIEESVQKGAILPNPFSLDLDNPEPVEKLPYIVVIIDELADLMMVEGKKVEQLIARLAQKARAAGIHLILATQRPSVDVITGLIKANIPTRISFQVSSKIDSRTILDQVGAESLLGRGDMLFLPPGTSEPTRLHGAFISDAEVLKVVNHIKSYSSPQYIDQILNNDVHLMSEDGTHHKENTKDELFDLAVEFIIESRKTSISSLQRHLRIGYNRAANLMESMEKEGIISPPELGGSRQILANKQQ